MERRRRRNGRTGRNRRSVRCGQGAEVLGGMASRDGCAETSTRFHHQRRFPEKGPEGVRTGRHGPVAELAVRQGRSHGLEKAIGAMGVGSEVGAIVRPHKPMF